MAKQIVGESLIVLIGTMLFFALAATVGIPGKEREPKPAVAAEIEGLGVRRSLSQPRFPLPPLMPFEEHWGR